MAAGDLALKILLTTVDTVSPIVVSMAATFNASLTGVGVTIAGTNEYLASLGDQAFTTGVGFDGLSASVDTVDASLAGVDASLTGVNASLVDVDASLVGLDASLSGVDEAASATDASLAGVSATAVATSASLVGVAASADTTSAGLKALGVAGATTLKLLGTLLAVVGIALAIMGVASVKSAGDFQNAMLDNVAHAGLAKDQVDNVTQALMKMGPAVGQGPTELAKALYPILSSFSGITNQAAKTQVALAELDNAAKSVAGTTTSVTTVSNAASAAFNAYGLATNNTATNISRMNNLFDVMNATVEAGNMKWSNYATKVGDLASKAAQSHVKFTEANAALAVFTNTGESVELAGTHLGALFLKLGNDSATLAAHAKKLGISFDANKFQSLDLAGKMQYLDQVTGNDPGKLKAILGNQTLAVTFTKLQGHIGNYQTTLKSLDNAHGATATAFQTVSTGWKQSMARVMAAGQALFIAIGQQLLPVLSKIADHIAPILAAFAAWLTKSGALTNGLNFVIGVISTLVGWVAAIVGFFQQNQWATDLLIAAFAGLAAGIIAFMVSALGPLAVMIVGLTIYALPGLIAMLWGAIVPLLPFIAIGLAVAAVIFGIIMAVQHWGQIVAWLKGVWAAFSSWFMGALKSVGDFFHSVWDGIINFFKAAWAFLVNAAKVGGMLLLAVIFAPIIAIAGLFIWLYQHNYYFKAMIDAIVGFVSNGVAWLENAWKVTISAIVTAWQQTVKFASDLWSKVSNAVHDGWSKSIAFVLSVWHTISSFFTNAWNTYIAPPLTALWGNVSRVFSSAWSTYVSSPLSNLWKSISKWFSDLGTNAMQSGKNFISMLVSGITSGAGAIWDAVTGIASQIWKALGFHSPSKDGPGKDADRWMPNLVTMLTSGLIAGVPLMHSASMRLAGGIASGLNSSSSGFALSGSNGGGSFALSGSNGGGSFALSPKGTTIIIQAPKPAPVYLDKRKVGDIVMDYASKEMRVQGGVRSR